MSIAQAALSCRGRKSALVHRGIFAAAAVILTAGTAVAQDFGDSLTPRLTPEVLATVAPDADRIGPYEGRPSAAAAYKDDQIIAYIFSTLDTVAAPGYSSVPFDVIGGIDVDGNLTAATVIAHNEPYIKYDAVRQGKINQFLASHLGYRTRGANPGRLPPDFVSGATVSARSMRAATLETARLIMRGRLQSMEVLEPTLDVDGFRLAAWEDLLEDGTFARATITNADLAQAFKDLGATPDEPVGAPDERFVELYTALGTPPTVGRNVFGARSFKTYQKRATLGGNFIIVRRRWRLRYSRIPPIANSPMATSSTAWRYAKAIRPSISTVNATSGSPPAATTASARWTRPCCSICQRIAVSNRLRRGGWY